MLKVVDEIEEDDRPVQYSWEGTYIETIIMKRYLVVSHIDHFNLLTNSL